MSLRRVSLLVVLGVLLAHATSARAEIAVSGSLDEADRRYGELDYRGAAELAQSAAQEPSATPAEQVRGWTRVGLCWLVLGQHRLAHEAFDKAFTLDPTYQVVDPSLSPRQREFIEEVRAKHPAQSLKPTPPPQPVTPVVAAPAPPTTTPPTSPPRRPVWKRWYVWTPIAIGVVAGVGLGVGLGLGLRRDGPSGSLATVGLGLRF